MMVDDISHPTHYYSFISSYHLALPHTIIFPPQSYPSYLLCHLQTNYSSRIGDKARRGSMETYEYKISL